ncbi:hypothetical protein [Acinetobacter sp.]|uniref:hypothetical protein n=1 Tax=Acinetobacter sp. TaxID=472 RepID=UPI00389097D0
MESDANQVVFTANNQLMDFDLGEDIAAAEHSLPDEVFFLAPEATPLGLVAQEQQNQALEENFAPTDDLFTTAKAQNLVEPGLVVDAAQMPQDILQVPKQELSGEWTLEKWEYWFRHSELSPALQELAQHGLMQGQIDADSTFMISPQYEQLLSSLHSHLEQALKTTWPNTRFSIQYQEVSATTPYHVQAKRKQLAQQRAVNLLQHEPVIKALIKQFDASLDNVEIK